MTAREKYFSPIWPQIKSIIDQKYMPPGATKDSEARFVMPKTIREIAKSYTDSVRNIPAANVQVVQEAVDAIGRKLGIKLEPRGRDRVINMLMTAHYGGTMWFRPFLAFRNLFKSALVVPEVGLEAWAHGLQRAATREGWREATDVLKLHRGAGQALPWEVSAHDLFGSSWANIQKTGMYLYRGADSVNRAVSYHAAKWAMDKYAPKYARGEITREVFLHKTGLARQYAPTKEHILQFLENRQVADIQSASREWGKQVVRNTQYPYRRGNEPMIFKGMWGRIFGQYGIWPANFAELVTRNTIGKTGATWAQKAQWAAKLAAVWTAMEYALEEQAGIDASRMTWINPFGFRGGPLWQAGGSAMQLMGGSDFERKMALARLKYQLTTFIPGSLLIRDIMTALEDTDDPAEWIKIAAGATPIDPDDAELFIPETIPRWSQDLAEGLSDEVQDLLGTRAPSVRPIEGGIP
jgi:hypothetical protein